jgi:hypothetical protein
LKRFNNLMFCVTGEVVLVVVVAEVDGDAFLLFRFSSHVFSTVLKFAWNEWYRCTAMVDLRGCLETSKFTDIVHLTLIARHQQ